MSSVGSATPPAPAPAPANRPASAEAPSDGGNGFAALLDNAAPADTSSRADGRANERKAGETKAGEARPAGSPTDPARNGTADTAKDEGMTDAAGTDASSGPATAPVVLPVATIVTPATPPAAVSAETGTAAGASPPAAPGIIGVTAVPVSDATAETAATSLTDADAASVQTPAPTPAPATGLAAAKILGASLPGPGLARLIGGNATAASAAAAGAEAVPDIVTAPSETGSAELEATANPGAKSGSGAETDPRTKTAKGDTAPPSGDAARAAKSDTPAAPAVRGAGEAAPASVPGPDVAQAGNAATALPQPHHALPTSAAPMPQVTMMPPAAAIPLSGLALNIAAQARAGASRFDIQLEPAELGRIDVRLSIDRHGTVTSHVVVEKAETLDLLRRDAPHLQRALDDAGLKTGSGGLQFSLRDGAPQHRDDNGQHTPSPRIVIADDVIAAEIAGRNYGRMPHASGGLDIRV